jgi:hypothetical protein
VRTTQIVPALLEHFDVTPPAYMEEPGPLRFA